jgi:DNA polymerase III alpha subunit
MNQFTFPCGCTIDLVNPKDINDYADEFPDCQMAWDSLCDGDNKGVWQVDKPLGKRWIKEIKPRCIEDLAVIGALLRPACTKGLMDGKSLTQHYADRKNGKSTVVYPHPAVEPILKQTYGILVYQESCIEITKVVAGFNLQEADNLRKAMGKKRADIMAEIKTQFLERAKEMNVVPYEVAEELFSWIEKSNRYNFNKAHSVCYAVLGYWSVYAKTHLPLLYYTASLMESMNEGDSYTKIQEFVDDAKLHKIPVKVPDLRYSDVDFKIVKKEIFFGLSSVKGIGEKAVEKMQKGIANTIEKTGKQISGWSWIDFLIYCSPYTISAVVQNLAAVGAYDYMGVSRTRIKYEYPLWKKLTEREKKWVIDNYPEFKWKSVLAIFESVVANFKLASNRKQTLDNIVKILKYPTQSLDDTPQLVMRDEIALLGTAITATGVDEYDGASANASCQDVFTGDCPKQLFVAAEIKYVNVFDTKRGRSAGLPMAKLTLMDTTATIDNVVCFAETYAEFKELLKPNAVVLIYGERDYQYNSLQVKKVFKLKHGQS